MALLQVSVVSPECVVHSGEASSLVAPAWDGQVGILPGHARMITLIGAGTIAVDRPGGGSDSYHVAGGVLKVEANHVTLLTGEVDREPPSGPRCEERPLPSKNRKRSESASGPAARTERGHGAPDRAASGG